MVETPWARSEARSSFPVGADGSTPEERSDSGSGGTPSALAAEAGHQAAVGEEETKRWPSHQQTGEDPTDAPAVLVLDPIAHPSLPAVDRLELVGVGPLFEGPVGLFVHEGVRVDIPMPSSPAQREGTEPEGEVRDHAVRDRAALVYPSDHRRWREPRDGVGGAMEAAHDLEGRVDVEGAVQYGHALVTGVDSKRRSAPPCDLSKRMTDRSLLVVNRARDRDSVIA